jgi:hypothetical protein
VKRIVVLAATVAAFGLGYVAVVLRRWEIDWLRGDWT